MDRQLWLGVDQQAVWAAVHEVAVEMGLPSAMVAKLRTWAAMRMGLTPAAIWHSDTGKMRESFPTAIQYAADTLANGEDPD